MKPKRFLVRDLTYKITWHIYIGGQLDSCIAHFAKLIGVPAWLSNACETCYGHFFAYRHLKHGGLWFKHDPAKHSGVLAHEAYHAVQYFFELMSAKLDENSEEFGAYYMEWLVYNIRNKT